MNRNNQLEGNPSSLLDPFGRTIDYLRLSVTDRCNLRCNYCMTEDMTFLPRQQILSLEELRDLALAFVELGIKKIRLTGGEPLVRRDIIKLVRSISNINGLQEITMTTNGMLLPKMAQQLKQAGLARLNISVDSLKPNKFREMTRNGDLSLWYEGIVAAKKANFTKIKLNTVVLAGVNDDEVIDLAHFAVSNEMDISFIEEMPLGSMSTHDRSKTQVTSANIREKLETKFHLIDSVETTGGPSRYSNVAGSTSKIGFISPMSNNFCESCNRVRMTAEGRLLLCLGNEHSADLRSVMRSHPGDQDLLKNEISKALKSKPERHYFDPNKIDIVRFMNMTGG